MRSQVPLDKVEALRREGGFSLRTMAAGLVVLLLIVGVFLLLTGDVTDGLVFISLGVVAVAFVVFFVVREQRRRAFVASADAEKATSG